MELVCIVCPKGCRISIEGDKVSGNSCKRGEAFARAEAVCPKRTVTTTVATRFKDFKVLSVKTDGEIPKEKINELMDVARSVFVTEKLKCGDIVVENVLGFDINLVATGNVITEER